MADIHEYLLKTKVEIADVLEKTESARRDRQELYRDLATYEFNFAKSNQYALRGLLNEMISSGEQKISQVKGLINFEITRGWLDDT